MIADHRRLPDDVLAEALRLRADGPSAPHELFEDVMTAVSGTSQRRGWTLHLPAAMRPVVIFVALAGLVVTMLWGTFVAGAGPSHRDPIELLNERSFIAPFRGWPPEGAASSTPDLGALVLNEFDIHPFRMASVYEDGRLIWNVEGELAGGMDSGGWVEQRLTPEGVELLGTGAVPLSVWPAAPASSLPASAWVDRALRAYVPSRYVFCYEFRVPDLQGSPIGQPSTQALEFLPNGVPVLLQGSWAPRDQEPAAPEDATCREVTTDTARTIEGIVVQAGAEGDGTYYTLHPPKVAPDVVLVTFYPLLPDGRPAIGFG